MFCEKSEKKKCEKSEFFFYYGHVVSVQFLKGITIPDVLFLPPKAAEIMFD